MSWLETIPPKLPASRDADVKRGLPRLLPAGVGIGSIFETDHDGKFRVEGFIENHADIEIIWGLSYPGSIW